MTAFSLPVQFNRHQCYDAFCPVSCVNFYRINKKAMSSIVRLGKGGWNDNALSKRLNTAHDWLQDSNKAPSKAQGDALIIACTLPSHVPLHVSENKVPDWLSVKVTVLQPYQVFGKDTRARWANHVPLAYFTRARIISNWSHVRVSLAPTHSW